MITSGGNAKPKDVHIHIHGFGKVNSGQRELNKHDEVTNQMNRGKEILKIKFTFCFINPSYFIPFKKNPFSE